MKLYYGNGSCTIEGSARGVEIRYRGAIEIEDKTSDSFAIAHQNNGILIFPLGEGALNDLFDYTGEFKITDLKFHFRNQLDNNPDMSSDIVMVNIDDYSKKQSGYDLWPYSYYAKTVEKINAGDPTSLGIDIIFTLTIDTLGWPRLLSAIENKAN